MRSSVCRAKALVLTTAYLAILHWPIGVGRTKESCGKTCAVGTLGCRLANYGKYQEAAWDHLWSMGIKHVFMDVPAPEQVEQVKRQLWEHGLMVSVLRGQTDLSCPTSVEEWATQLATCQRLGVQFLFLSPKHPGVSKEVACERLRQAGEIAREHGVTIVLETHPDLGTNGDEHVATMKRINHPNVRINFDTGNITFYNHNSDAVTELKKCIDYVATVELKDHNGQYESWTFPAIGQGVVDFPAVMSVLHDHHFTGPITLELEGTRGIEMNEAQTKAYIERSAAYVQSLALAHNAGDRGERPARTLVAKTYNSGFTLAHDTYNGISCASDGNIYYVLSSESIDVGAQVYAFDPTTSRPRHLGDLTQACGEKGLKTIVQGKSHVNFVECQGKLYFATHIGYYSIVDGMEKMGVPPAGYKSYPGGHLLAYDMACERFENLVVEPHGEGILTMNMDCRRGRIYGITWPKGYFFRYDLARKELKDFGQVAGAGEDGKGPTYSTLCRSLAVDPVDGSVYYSTATGTILRYDFDRDAVEPVEGEDLKKDYFGLYDPTSPGHMGYNWRQVVWHGGQQAFYGVHGNSGYLFRFDPRAGRVVVLDRITSESSKQSGMFDQFSYGYLGFTLGPDQRTLYYLTGSPVYVDGRRVAGKAATAMGESKGIENLHLITWDIPTGTYTDHGAIFLDNGQRPAYVNSIAVGKDGTVYALSRITENEHTRTDLISVDPVKPNSALATALNY